MKWRRVKPNPCEFFWTKMVRGPCHDMPSTSPDDRGRRLFSLDDTMPSLRPLACREERKYKMFRSILLSFSLPLGSKHCQTFTMSVLKYILRTIFRGLHWTCVCDCIFIQRWTHIREVWVGGCGRMWSIHWRLCPDPTRAEFHQCQRFLWDFLSPKGKLYFHPQHPHV